jgi:hypothetical protein
MVTILILLALVSLGTYFYMKQPKFGKAATGERLEKMKLSPNYKNGKFENLLHTPAITEGYSYATVMYEFFLRKRKGGFRWIVFPA